VQTAAKAVQIADSLGQEAVAKRIKERLHLYEASQPYRP